MKNDNPRPDPKDSLKTPRSGWPDLTIIRNGLILWVEVKTTDKLHMSQLVTLSRMKDLLPGELKVLQITNPTVTPR